MKKSILVLSQLSLIFQVSLCQYSLPQELINNTVLIDFESGISGSGCFYGDSNNVFIITARHVILQEKKDKKGKVIDYSLNGSKASVKFYARDSDKNSSNEMILDLIGLYKSGKLKYSPDSDILVINIAKIEYEGYPHVSYNKFVKRSGEMSMMNSFGAMHIGKFKDARPGNDIFIFGYPKSLGLKQQPQFDFNRPLLRKGTLAGKYIDKETIIIDCPSFGGNSGGPVLEVRGNPFNAKVQLIGIVVSFIPFTETWLNPTYNLKNMEIVNSGYSVVEPIDKILKLINETK